jgi:hypothetical protein
VYRTNRLTTTRRVGISSAVAIGVLVTGAGIAGASTHHQSKIDVPWSSTASPLPDQARGLGGVVSAVIGTSITVKDRASTPTTYSLDSSTTVTKERTAVAPGDLAVGAHVRLTLSPNSSTTASSVEIELVHAAGQVVSVTGSTFTVTDYEDANVTISVTGTTTYSKSGFGATLAHVTVGSFVFAEGTFDFTNSVLTATTVGIGRPKFDGGHEGFAMMGGGGGGIYGPADHGRMGGFGGPRAMDGFGGQGAMGGNR